LTPYTKRRSIELSGRIVMSSSKAHTVAGGGGLELHVEETGNAAGRSVLFIHGISQCRLAWNRQLHSDLARDFRLVAMDLRGHGLSQKPRDVYGDSKLWADDVKAVIDTLELDRPVLCGWSYGGIVIGDYVREHGEDAIAGTNWVGAISKLGDAIRASGFIGPDFLANMPGLFAENLDDGVAALERLVRLCFAGELAPEDHYFVLGYNTIVPTHVRAGLVARALDHDDVIRAMRKPMLLSYGQRDACTLPAMGEHLARLAPHARLSLYPNAGHSPFWEAPERFNRELRELIETAVAPAGRASAGS
jgi:pimeloyl-ACP methyl ester carboxylesterase